MPPGSWEKNRFAAKDIFTKKRLIAVGRRQRYMKYGRERQSFICRKQRKIIRDVATL
jgi:hypothetical protein